MTPVARRVLPAAVAAVLVVLAVLAVLADAPSWVRTPLVLLAAAGTAGQLVRGGRRRSPLDRVLTAAGGCLVVLVLVGVVLGVTGAGLRPGTWALALGVPALAGLAVSTWAGAGPARGPAPVADPVGPGSLRRAALLTSPWAVAAAAVTVLALVVSVRSVAGESASPVQVSLASLDGAQAVVAVTASRATGPLELRTDPGDGSAVTYPLFSVPEGGTVETVVVVPVEGRVVVTVSNPGQVQPLRTLVVNR
ncbi:hypothetical protein FHR75_001532 [Kineococcus radiotolerans]|uniref:Uncharacterized protein n=1 Tax=Kineococcus radiotolerans TaxID=131568 RepID=A0A7W4TKT4_KINRA|nr:hypothetical protein [Kineococcus radiotolerans]MBB2900744.1 hypothetical protein [Kineococcus radiotolerans]